MPTATLPVSYESEVTSVAELLTEMMSDALLTKRGHIQHCVLIIFIVHWTYKRGKFSTFFFFFFDIGLWEISTWSGLKFLTGHKE